MYNRSSNFATGISDFTKNMRVRCPGELIRVELMRQEAERLGVVVTDKMYATSQKKYLKETRQGKISFDKFVAKLPAGLGQTASNAVRIIARGDECLRKSTTNNLEKISKEEIAEIIKRGKEINKEADAKNLAQIERAKAAKAEILAGAKFADVAEARADFAKEQGREWDTFELNEFDGGDPMPVWLATANPGDISDPMELDDGYSIVGLVSKYLGDADEESEPQMQYQVVRCAFYIYDKIDESDFEDEDELAETVLEERRKQAMIELGLRLTEAATIEYPLGEEVFHRKKVKKSAHRKSKKAQKPGNR